MIQSVLKISRFPEAKEEWKRKYRVEKMFEDDGNVASGITKSVYDVRTHKLIMTGECQKKDEKTGSSLSSDLSMY